ncbi:MAG: HEAT repeat domain-containing protein [Cyanobacteriota bacterium]|nr:HEAT repeat domain-containing protein [Cyanobacteriota bacterium]
MSRNNTNHRGEITEECHLEAEKLLRNSNLGQNDVASATLRERLAVELLKFAPVPEWFLSEWVPADWLLAGVKNPVLPRRYRVKLLERLAKEPFMQPRLEAAEHPDTPVSVLEKLAGDVELPVRVALRHNPNCPTEAMAKAEAQVALASNWETDAQQLAELAESPWSWVRRAVAGNPSSPPSVLEKFAEGDCYPVQLAVARNPSSLTAALEKLITIDDMWMRRSLAKHPNASERMLLQLLPTSEERDCEERDCEDIIVERENLPVRVIEQLVEESDRYYKILQQQNITPAILRRMLVRWPRYNFAKIARHPRASAKLLERLAGDSDAEVRQEVARNLNAPLEQLAEDSDATVRLAVAGNPNTSEDLRVRLLEELAAGSDVEIRAEIARDPQTPIYLLEQLAPEVTGEEIWILKALAGNPSTPASILETLGQVDPHSNFGNLILTALARNPRAPAKVLEALGGLEPEIYFQNWWVRIALGNNPAVPEARRLEYLEETIARREGREAIAKNPNTPTFILERLVEQAPGWLGYIASNPNTPLSLLKRAAESTKNSVLENVATNPNTPPALLEELALKGKTTVREAVFKHSALDALAVYRIQLQLEEREKHRQAYQTLVRHTSIPQAFAEVAKSGDSDDRLYIAGSCKTPVSVMELLATDQDENVRRTLAENCSLPLDLRLQLTRDPSYGVRASLAKERYRFSTPVEVLETLAADESEYVRAVVAGKRETPSSVLENLAHDESQKVRRAVVRNPNTPIVILKEMARNNPELKEGMLQRKPSGNEESDRFLAELLQEFASSDDDSIRYKIAGHPKTPISVLERLASDRFSLVRDTIAENPNTPSETLIQMASQEKLTTSEGCFHTVSNKIAMRRDAPPEALDFVARQPVTFIRQETLENRNTSADTLAWLAANESDINILCGIARHPNVSGDVEQQLSRHENQAVRGSLGASSYLSSILETLALDESQDVREQVATNSSAPVNLLEMLASDSAAEVRAAVAANNDAPGNILERLAEDEKVEVRRAVAENPATPTPVRESLQDLLPQTSDRQLSPTLRGLGRIYNPETDDLPSLLSEYARSPVAFVRFVALMHPLTPAEALAEGSQSLCWWERYAVACNGATPAEIRERLAGDSDRIVRAVCSDR